MSLKKFKKRKYESLFIRRSPVTARNGKLVYVRQKFHDNINSICHVSGNKVSISGYIDNVLAHHFATYGDEADRFYNERHQNPNFKENQ